MDRYDPKTIEEKWQKIWEESEAFKAGDDETKPKMYLAEMFPYPSGAGLHVGHVRNFTIVDVLTRFYTQQEKHSPNSDKSMRNLSNYWEKDWRRMLLICNFK